MSANQVSQYFGTQPSNITRTQNSAGLPLAHILNGRNERSGTILADTPLPRGALLGDYFLSITNVAAADAATVSEETVEDCGLNFHSKAVHGWFQEAQHFLHILLVYLYIGGGAYRGARRS